ncbi:hypothetical protein D3C76_1513090 [compost metagenome]
MGVRFTLDGELKTGIGFIDAGDDFNQRRFTATVLPGQTVNFSGNQRQVDVIQRFHTVEGFADLTQ